MSDHREVFVESLGCGIDEQIVELVALLNGVDGVRTTSSCQGNPGVISYADPYSGVGSYGHVAFRKGGWHTLCAFCFSVLVPLIEGLGDDVGVEVDWSPSLVLDEVEKSRPFNGWLRFRNEAVPQLTKLLREGRR